MIINSIALRTPSMCVTNEGVLIGIRETNSGLPCATVEAIAPSYANCWSGRASRRVTSATRQTASAGFELLIDSAREAIREGGIALSDIDLIIFCGVGRGFLEPANAIFVAKALGLECDAFDVGEACMSGVRSLQTRSQHAEKRYVFKCADRQRGVHRA